MVTLAVTWTLSAVWLRIHIAERMLTTWPVQWTHRRPAAAHDAWETERLAGRAKTRVLTEQVWVGPTVEACTIRYECGWPARGLWVRIRVLAVNSGRGPGLEHRWHNGLLWPGLRRDLYELPVAHWPIPMVPVWPGFALDTAFYAAIALTLRSAPGLIRRRLRQARGHCPHCGYNLQGAPTKTCPECGA
jgi:hypothetical protein